MMPAQSKSGNLWAKIGLGVVIGLIVLGGIGYFGAGYYVFDLLSASPGGCRQPFMQELMDNEPDDFQARYRADEPLMDVSAYHMPDFEDVRFSARGEDVTLAGYLIEANVASDDVIVIVHGINGCRREPTQLIPAGMLANNGFDVLVMDLRNHGDSEVPTGRMAAGNHEFRDVLGAIDYLRDEHGYATEDIGLMGVSLGTGSTTLAFALEPELPALFLESPFSSIEDMVQDQFERNGFPNFLITPAFQFALWHGIDYYEYSPNTNIADHGDRPIQIVHGEADERIPLVQATSLHALAGANAELTIFPDLDHVEAIYNTQDDYEAILVDFFADHLK